MSEINGIIVLDKPAGKTSHDMVYFMRRLTGIKKVGHTGTLDPDATGVLPICIGSATKAADMITMSDKLYRAGLVFGVTTDTQDSSGKILSEQKVSCTEDEIRDAILSFAGVYSQLPPMYSAVKRNGRKLYELAREGKTVERETRTVEIKDIKILRLGREPQIEVLCSKGTYIRTLCHDIGQKLGTGACMTSLRRLRTGGFTEKDSHTCEELLRLKDEGRLADAVISVDDLFPDYERIRLTPNQTKSVKNGVLMTYHRPDGLYRVYDDGDKFICVGTINGEKLKVYKSFWT